MTSDIFMANKKAKKQFSFDKPRYGTMRKKQTGPKMVTINAVVKSQTVKGYWLWDGRLNASDSPVYKSVPKCLVTINSNGTVTMPENIAYERGFLT